MSRRRTRRRIRRSPTLAALAALALYSVPINGVGAEGEVVVPSERCRGLWIVPVAFGDAPGRALELVLDTGAWPTTVDPDAVRRVFGRRVAAGRKVTLRRGRAGPLEVKRLRARTHEMDHLARALGRPIDGILGFAVFGDLLLTLDYPKGEVRLARGRLGEPDGERVFADVGSRVSSRRPFLAVEVEAARLPVLIDSGFTGGLDLRPDDHLTWKTPPRPVSGAVRYHEVVEVTAGRLDGDLAFGPLELERPVVRVSDGTRLAGAEVLDRLAITFDQKSRRLGIVAEGDGPLRMPPERGLGVVMHPRDGGFEVARVFEGSPAAAAGLEPGDLVSAIDGTPVALQGCVRPWDRPDAGRVRLTVRRGGEEIDVEVEVGVLVP